eukprot:766080-Hanusia_phi.AAC.2
METRTNELLREQEKIVLTHAHIIFLTNMKREVNIRSTSRATSDDRNSQEAGEHHERFVGEGGKERVRVRGDAYRAASRQRRSRETSSWGNQRGG